MEEEAAVLSKRSQDFSGNKPHENSGFFFFGIVKLP